DLREVLPEPLIEGMIAALRHFDRRLPGFAGPEAVLVAPETRTTAPLRFLRDEQLTSTGVADLMPLGEGAGYAGGIVSAALDGMRIAEAIVHAR
ncbi:MAG: FAD-dependent oxidoreductase, partial [Myxococcales bacterium]|nr:FAD-dependent oxidoreductase [Myxococcales bacterium]